MKTANPTLTLKPEHLTAEGRLDVLCRTIVSAFFLGGAETSKFRRQVTLEVYFQSYGRVLTINGSKITGLHPDERSIAGWLRLAFSGRSIDGVSFMPGAWETILGVHDGMLLLDREGEMDSTCEEIKSQKFVLGDHIGLTAEEKARFPATRRISLGREIYLTSQCVSVLNYLMDLPQPE